MKVAGPLATSDVHGYMDVSYPNDPKSMATTAAYMEITKANSSDVSTGSSVLPSVTNHISAPSTAASASIAAEAAAGPPVAGEDTGSDTAQMPDTEAGPLSSTAEPRAGVGYLEVTAEP